MKGSPPQSPRRGEDKYREGGGLGLQLADPLLYGLLKQFGLPKRIVIEIDGGYHQLPNQQVSDTERSEWLEKKGFKVIRFTNKEVLCNLEETIKIIKECIK